MFAQGERGKQLFGVISGQIRISTESANGQELYLNIIYPGEIVGEIAFLDGGTRTATGRAAQPSTCFVIQRAPFHESPGERAETCRSPAGTGLFASSLD